ncbi:MAG TPA: CBS domain-containing protein [Vulgatibacter sp.]|nr:CBS domain-containing protein [Vulgatibacter sp.]
MAIEDEPSGDGRGTARDLEEHMEETTRGGGGSWRTWGPEQIREDLDWRTDEEEIDRRLMWDRGRRERSGPGESPPWFAREGRDRGRWGGYDPYESRESAWRARFWPPEYGEGRGGGRHGRERWGGEERWPSGEREPRWERQRGAREGQPWEGPETRWPGGGDRWQGRGHRWRPGEPRIWSGGEYRGRETGQWGEGRRREGGEWGSRRGRHEGRQGREYGRYGRSWTEDMPPRAGYGGYGGGAYGGSYGGMGPGEADIYRPSGTEGGATGYGSMEGTYGLGSGWEPERMGVRRRGMTFQDALRESRRREGFRGSGRWEQEGATVRDLMTRDPKYVEPEVPARDAARLMREEDAGIVPVVLDGRVLGVITDRDLTVRVLAEGRDPGMVKCREVMTGDVQTCHPDDRLTDAVRIMGEENVRRLPVVGRDGRLQGILSMTDVAREAELDYALQEALEQIASRRSFWSRW